MFSIHSEPFGPATRWLLCNDATDEYAAVVPNLGANLQALLLRHAPTAALVPVLQGYKTAAEWQAQNLTTYHGAKLTPFCNRVAAGRYSFGGHDYQLPINEAAGNALHGVVAARPFAVRAQAAGAHGASLTVGLAYGGDAPGYPFPFGLELVFELDASGLTCTTTLHNPGPTALPATDGWHPYLQLPGTRADDLEITLPTAREILVDAALIPTGRTADRPDLTAGRPLGARRLDSCFGPITAPGRAETLLRDPATGRTLVHWQQAGPGGYNYVQVYTPPDRRSVAVEANSGPPDALNSREGLTVLEPGGSAQWVFGLALR